MSDVLEPRFAATGEQSILRRLREIERRADALAEQFQANEREYAELRDSEALLVAEESSLRARLAALGSGHAA